MKQRNLFSFQREQSVTRFVSVYRVSLVKDKNISFGHRRMNNSQEAQALIKSLIEAQGQSDREQFCVILLNSKNEIIGLNIVSTGDLASATVHPREVLKPAILSNSASMVLCHNHPSNNLEPSPEDIAITRKIVKAAEIIGITVHEHIIISMDDDCYFSFADQGIIKRIYDGLK